MRSKTVLRSLFLAAVTVCCALSFSVPATQAAKYKNVHWLSLSGTSSKAPGYVFFTANAGGYVSNLKWKRWGAEQTVGRGNFGTTAPCNGRPCPAGPARLVLRKPVLCTPAFGDKQGKKIRVYRFGTLYYPNWDGRRLKAGISTGWGACRQALR